MSDQGDLLPAPAPRRTGWRKRYIERISAALGDEYSKYSNMSFPPWARTKRYEGWRYREMILVFCIAKSAAPLLVDIWPVNGKVCKQKARLLWCNLAGAQGDEAVSAARAALTSWLDEVAR